MGESDESLASFTSLCERSAVVYLALLFPDLSSTLSPLSKKFCTPKGTALPYTTTFNFAMAMCTTRPDCALLKSHILSSLLLPPSLLPAVELRVRQAHPCGPCVDGRDRRPLPHRRPRLLPTTRRLR